MEIKLTFEEEGFDGHVIMMVAKNSERLRTLGALGLKPKDMTPKKMKSMFENLDTIGEIIDRSEHLYKEVKLSKDGVEYNSFNDLANDFAVLNIQVECAVKSLMNLGEIEKKSKS